MRTKQNKMTVTGRNYRQAGNAVTRASGHVLPLSNEDHQLKQMLADERDVRAGEVARGKALIANPDYPSKEQMKKIAGLLAENSNGRENFLKSSDVRTEKIVITTVAA